MADDDQDQEQDDGTDLVPRSHIRQLEAQAKEARELKERLATMERRSAFAEALGSSTGEPWFTYFQAGYSGEMTSEAIREAASAAGFAKTAPVEPTEVANATQSNPNDLAAIQRMAQAQVGSAPPPPFDAYAEIAKAQSAEEVLDVLDQMDPEKTGVISSRRNIQ